MELQHIERRRGLGVKWMIHEPAIPEALVASEWQQLIECFMDWELNRRPVGLQ